MCCAPLCVCVLHAQSWERLFWLTEQLQPREEQRLAITAGCEVFKRLLDRVIEARQVLLKQQAAQSGVRLPNGRSADLETEQQMVKQLQSLERQEQFLVIFAALFVACVQTWCSWQGRRCWCGPSCRTSTCWALQ
jgi:hypothetical protein